MVFKKSFLYKHFWILPNNIMTSTTNSSVGGQQLGTPEALNKINSDQEASNIYLQFEQPQSSGQHLEVLNQLENRASHEQHQPTQTQITESHQEPTSSDSSTSIKESKRTGHGKRKLFLSNKLLKIFLDQH